MCICLYLMYCSVVSDRPDENGIGELFSCPGTDQIGMSTFPDLDW